MTTEEIKNKIKEFLKNNQLTVIATVDTETNKPESAVIGFTETDNLEIFFGTSNLSRKYKNLQKNPNVSFVIGWDGRIGTVQYEGIAKELSKTEREQYIPLQIAKNPFSKKFMDRPDQAYFLVKPTWIRVTDMSKSPNEIYEINIP